MEASLAYYGHLVFLEPVDESLSHVEQVDFMDKN